ncbi:DUF1080 domain-containing protein [Belliella marina]|uniref:DUF1080 domain-containing protein n=1 Tax=Belliella marina TaxID=1644146 RepID=A0ABW4VW84_9BACT
MKKQLFYLGASMLFMACNTEKKAESSEAIENEPLEVKQDNTLTEEEKAAGWMLLFDGENVDGWRAYNGDTFPDGWTIEEESLKGLGLGGDIGGDIVFGAMEFSEFELEFDWKIGEGGNSGVFYHVVEGEQYKAPYYTAPEYQVIDQLGFPQKLELWQSIGADYAMYDPDFEGAVKPAGEWNSSKIIFSEKGASYWLNGKKTVEFIPYSEDWNKRKNSGKWDDYPDYAISKTGLIGLQDHGSSVWFKNIKIKNL